MSFRKFLFVRMNEYMFLPRGIRIAFMTLIFLLLNIKVVLVDDLNINMNKEIEISTKYLNFMKEQDK